MPVFEDFEQITALVLGQRCGPKVVEHQQLDLGPANQELRVEAIALGDGQVVPKPGQAQILCAISFSTRLVGQGTGEPGFPQPRRTGDEQIVMRCDLAGSQAAQQGFIQAAGVAVANVLSALGTPRPSPAPCASQWQPPAVEETASAPVPVIQFGW